MDLRKLLKKRVRVIGGGVAYEGKLIEATSESILLKTDSGFVSVGLDRVSAVTSTEEIEETNLASNNFVSRSFYEFDPSE